MLPLGRRRRRRKNQRMRNPSFRPHHSLYREKEEKIHLCLVRGKVGVVVVFKRFFFNGTSITSSSCDPGKWRLVVEQHVLCRRFFLRFSFLFLHSFFLFLLLRCLSQCFSFSFSFVALSPHDFLVSFSFVARCFGWFSLSSLSSRPARASCLGKEEEDLKRKEMENKETCFYAFASRRSKPLVKPKQ